MLVSFVSWCFLELVHWIQTEVYQSLPSGLGLQPVPWWWPLPVLAVAGVLAAVAILRLPGRGGHIPYKGVLRDIQLIAAGPFKFAAAFRPCSIGHVAVGPISQP